MGGVGACAHVVASHFGCVQFIPRLPYSLTLDPQLPVPRDLCRDVKESG